ncbi:AraC family transcriptional regulator [Ammoniphilus sp. 3BR4]|uniref:response regulator transcription factor n=1 Tax=Ammoniphilus sp. 3BR4 TaxID=3158265 RepID=UPI0034662DAD
MIRLVVIDDEVFVRKGIISSVPWERHGIEIAGEAPDGESGLELIRRTNPHIILTDIRMPRMDGLELIRHVRSELPQAKILILSVLEDFSTVREALRLGVVDYVQKLMMTPDELAETVLKIKQSLELEKDYHADWQQPDHLGKWLQGKAVPMFDQVLNDSVRYVIGKVRLDQTASGFEEFRGMLARSRHVLLQQAMVSGATDGGFWMLLKEETGPLSLKRVEDALRELLDEHPDCSLTIGLSRIMQGSVQRQAGREQADEAMQERFLKGDGQIFHFRKKEPQPAPLKRFFDRDDFKYYFASLKRADPLLVSEAFARLFPPQLDETVSPATVRDAMTQWVSSIMIFVQEFGVHIGGPQSESSPFEQMGNIETYPELRGWCLRIQETAMDLLLTLRSSTHRSEIEQAKEYIHTHYGESIMVKEVADRVGLSENYFSYLFKKETGKPFSQYLQETRVEKAKEWLEHGEIHWINIGEQVGFESPKYFSKVFKKYTGMTPMQYAKEKGKGLLF